MAYETMHGFAVRDPFRALEEDSAATRQFDMEQHRATEEALGRDPYWPLVNARLTALTDRGDQGVPQVRGSTLAYLVRPATGNQSRLEVMNTPGGRAQVVYDPSGAETPEAVDWFTLSEDGRYVFYGVSEQGDEWTVLKIYDCTAGKTLTEAIPGTRWASVSMAQGQNSFFYTRYPLNSDNEPQFYHQRVYQHVLGTDYHDDAVVYQDDSKTATFSVSSSDTGSHLLIETHRGWSANRLVLRAVACPGSPDATLFDSFSERIEPFWHHNQVYGVHRHAGNFGEIVRWDSDTSNWQTVTAEVPGQPLEVCAPCGGGLLTLRWKDARALLQWTSPGGDVRKFPLPHEGIGTVFGIGADPLSSTAYVGWTSFDQPRQVYAVDTAEDRTRPWGSAVAPIPDIDIWSESVPSTGGAIIPIFLAKRGSGPIDHPLPAIVGGYGGFNIAYSPAYSAGIQLWLESGGLYIVAGLRGGSERGEPWHQAGMRAEKQNVFDDMANVLRYLADRGYTRPESLGITGRSNGGLLTGALVTQHPELMRAAVIGVPLLDMLRYDQFLVAALWTAEYGDPHRLEEWGWLQRYSPYHHVVPNTRYPAVLMFTSAHDSRVAPLHARKMAARLQQATASGYPVHLRIEPQAGHGVGKTRQQTVSEESDIWTFEFRQLGLSPKTPKA